MYCVEIYLRYLILKAALWVCGSVGMSVGGYPSIS